MPLIQVNMLEGRTDEQKEALLRSITAAVHESIGAPIDSIRVWIHEFAHTEFISAGVMATERLKTGGS
jgi:4-oxalocrotonate tautomerase